MSVIVAELEYAEKWDGNAKLVKWLETVQMTAAKKSTRMLKRERVEYGIDRRTGNVEKAIPGENKGTCQRRSGQR